jgi:nitronate monooxygenase
LFHLTMAIATRFTRRFGLDAPIVSAPMGMLAGGRLAAAVTRAGGLGLIGGGYGNAEWLDQAFADAGNVPVGCGFITWSLARSPDLLDRALARAPTALMLSFGDPAPMAPAIHAAGVPLICQVQSVALARAALDAGAAVIVAQGSEAGGHGGDRGTLTLVPEVADLLAKTSPDTLLLAAGGIVDGRGVAAALMLGADGVLMGSRLLATPEADVPDGFRATILATAGDETVRTAVPDVARGYDWPPGFLARSIRTDFVDEWHGREGALADPATNPRERARYWAGFRSGDAANTVVMAGEGVGLVHSVAPVAEVFAAAVAEAEQLLAGAEARIRR